MRIVLLLQAAATLFLTGVIWFVQVVHYPLMARVGNSAFAEYETAHARLTGYVVILPMLVELVCSVLLLVRRPHGASGSLILIGVALVVLIWLSTFLLQVPQHNTLQHAFDVAAHTRLVATNWIRTFAWTIRAILVLWMLR